MICNLCEDTGVYDDENCPDCYGHFCRILRKSPLEWTDEERAYLFPGMTREVSLQIVSGTGRRGRLTAWERLDDRTVRETVTWEDGTVETTVLVQNPA